MSDHSTVLVPIESWSYNSPSLLANGHLIDIGLFAEALIYYDSVIVNVGSPAHFQAFLNWFVSQGKYADFIALVNDGVIKIYDYSFTSTAICKDGEYSIWNVQSELEAQPDTFEQRFLHNELIPSCLKKSRDREKLYKALRGNVIEAKSEEFSNAIENARADLKSPERNSLIVQSFVDELYAFRKLGQPPEVISRVIETGGEKRNITWNIDFGVLSSQAGKELNFRVDTPLTADVHSNRIVHSASSLKCDLYLGKPIGSLVGDKLYESSIPRDKAHSIIESLKDEVEFPDIRFLVNSGGIGLDVILDIRKKGGNFRNWLQDESDRDHNAIFAYHFEVAKEAGFRTVTRRSLSIFGVLSSGAVGAYVGESIGGPVGGAVGGMVGSAISYVAEVASKLNSDWKPVVFGEWTKSRIKKILDKDK